MFISSDFKVLRVWKYNKIKKKYKKKCLFIQTTVLTTQTLTANTLSSLPTPRIIQLLRDATYINVENAILINLFCQKKKLPLSNKKHPKIREE